MTDAWTRGRLALEALQRPAGGRWAVEPVGELFVACCPHGVRMPDSWPTADRAWVDTLDGCPCRPDPVELTELCAEAVCDSVRQFQRRSD